VLLAKGAAMRLLSVTILSTTIAIGAVAEPSGAATMQAEFTAKVEFCGVCRDDFDIFGGAEDVSSLNGLEATFTFYFETALLHISREGFIS
jgi:hypothetical protein